MNLENTFESKIHKVLVDNILSFWQKNGINFNLQLPYGKVDDRGIPVGREPIGAILTARVLWAFSAAYDALKIYQYAETAKVIHQRLIDCFFDQSNGGLWYAVSSDGTVSDQSKFTDCQAYAIYALCEYFNISGEEKALSIAVDLFDWIEKNVLDGQNESYFDSYLSAKGAIHPAEKAVLDGSASVRSLNTHLHLLEAYTSLYHYTGDSRIKGRLTNVFDLLVDHFYGDGLFFTHLSEDIRPFENSTLYGLNLETAWLLSQASVHLKDESYSQKINTILQACASKVLAVAMDEDGGVYYSGKGCRPVDLAKQWWVQAEAAVAFLIAYEKSLKSHFFDAFLMVWDYILRYLVDWQVGEWRLGLTRENEVMGDDHRSGFWKCPYHTTRVCLETLKRKELIRNGLEHCIQTETPEVCLESSFHSES